MMVGNAEYQCSCVRYVPSRNNTALAIGLSVGLGLLLLILIVITAIFLYHRRQSRLTELAEMSTVNPSTNQVAEDERYSRQLPDDYNKPVFDKEGSGYSRSLPADFVQDYRL